MTLKFNFGDALTITSSGEHGEVFGRAEYKFGEPSYFLRYVNAHGVAVEQWWNESALTPTATAEALRPGEPG